MKFRSAALAAVLGLGGFFAGGLVGRDMVPATQPAHIAQEPAVSAPGIPLQGWQAVAPPVGDDVSVFVEQPTGELSGKLTSINDRWAVLDTRTMAHNIGVFWIPVSKIQCINIQSK